MKKAFKWKKEERFQRSYALLGILDEDKSDVGKGKTMTEVEVMPMTVEGNTVVRGILDELRVKEDMMVGSAEECGGSTVGLPLRPEDLELGGGGELVDGNDVLELNEVEGSVVNVSVVVLDEVRDVEICWMGDGDCGGSNEDVQVETLDEVPGIVMLTLEDEDIEGEDVLAPDVDVAGIFKVSSDFQVKNHGNQLNRSKKEVSRSVLHYLGQKYKLISYSGLQFV